ncbi:hypothetical protein PT974_06675 [Cladobotryum mycophilum]|uniref:Antifungal protein n=1 Tax=Cladobotryum mycophilum TaxID=491253 RepID=A0ABR0SNE1_9HYPO
MFSLRSILLAVALLETASFALAAPPPVDINSITQDVQPIARSRLQPLDVLSVQASCYVTSKKGKNCHASMCPANEQCKVNDKGTCVYKNAKKSRSFGCEQCSCKTSN